MPMQEKWGGGGGGGDAALQLIRKPVLASRSGRLLPWKNPVPVN